MAQAAGGGHGQPEAPPTDSPALIALTSSPMGVPRGCLDVLVTWQLASPRVMRDRINRMAATHNVILEVAYHHFFCILVATQNGTTWEGTHCAGE